MVNVGNKPLIVCKALFTTCEALKIVQFQGACILYDGIESMEVSLMLWTHDGGVGSATYS